MEENGHDLNKVLSRHLPEGPEKTTKLSLRIVGYLAEIGTEHFLNTNLERYNYTNML